MKFTLAYSVATAAVASAQKGGGGLKGAGGGGAGTPVNGKTPGVLATGPYKAAYWQEPGLTKHTVFAPMEVPPGVKLPVMVWGNGACSGNGTYFRRSLFQAASQGFWIIANGNPTGGAGTKSSYQVAAVKWVKENAGKGKYSFIDGSRIAAAGQSCGGLETYEVAINPAARDAISFVGIFNSGEFGTSKNSLQVKQPIFYFLGGPSDIAYANGERDYKNVRQARALWKGNLPVGHMATWSETNGGKFGKAEWMWLDWVLRGNAKSGQFFTGGGAKADGWTVESKNLDKVNPFPPYGSSPPVGSAPSEPAAPPEEAGGEE